MTTGASFHRGQSKQDYSTPPEFIAAVEHRFGKLHLDLAAHDRNHITPEWYGPGGLVDDSLVADWSTAVVGCHSWLNPPFDRIEPWAMKCADTVLSFGQKIFFLVPASVGAKWYARYVHGKACVYFLTSRLSFDGKAPFPKDCLLAVYNPNRSAAYECWDWKAQCAAP